MIAWNAAAATLCFWVGIALALRGLFQIVKYLIRAPGLDASGTAASIGINLGFGALGLLLSGFLFPSTGIGIPIVWPVLCVQHWITLLALIACTYQGIGAIVAPDEASRTARLRNVGFSVVLAVVSLLLPRANTSPPTLLTGHIELPVVTAFAIVLLSVATVIAVAFAVKSSVAKGVVRAVSTQIGLLIGCVVFGLPFLFLLVTSFKEDKDMSSPNGIVWIPRVVQTRPVMNPKHPFYEAKYKGITVQADLDKVNPDGTLSLRIEHPVYFGGYTFDVPKSNAREIPREMELVTATYEGVPIEAVTFEKLADGSREVEILKPASLKGERRTFGPKETELVRPVSLRWKNYVEALEYLPPEAAYGWTYLRNTLTLVVMNVLGALISSSLVAYGFARLRFPGREIMFKLMLSTMMLPAAVTLLPQFLIFRSLGWIDSLKPMWVTSWFAAAFNVFMLRQFFQQVPYELEDAAKIDGCTYLRSLWSVMLPQVKPALAVIAIMTFMGAWNNFMGPLVYSSSPETLPISYAVQLFNGERNGDPGLLMAFVTMSLVPVIALFAFAQRFFIEGVTLSGMGGR